VHTHTLPSNFPMLLESESWGCVQKSLTVQKSPPF